VRVLVTGGRKYANRARVYSALDAVHAKHGISLLIEGGARGADRLARDWAKLRRVPHETCEADWDRYGNAAGGIRNSQMLADWKPEAVVAFKGGTGTADMVAKAERARVPVWRVPETPICN
jgi:predicted polyphosphate/ATP-dependent NAD kinase